jgi:PAS domain S-box-containing protein
VFPRGALVWIFYFLNESQTPISLGQAHNAQPLLYIVDLAPSVLGVTFAVLVLKVGSQKTARLPIEDEYRCALSVAKIPIIMTRTNGYVEECNVTVEKLLGLPQIEIIGKNVLRDFVRVDAQDEILNTFTDLLQTEELYNLEIPLIDAVGNLKLVLVSARVRLNTAQEADGFLIFGQDIAQLRNQET